MELDKIVEGLDKKIVENNILLFNRLNDTHKLLLNDDGIVEDYLNEKLCKSFNFSKLGLLRECKNLLQEGYILNEADIMTNNNEDDTVDVLDNPEQTKQDLQQDIKDVEEIQELQDELDNKLDTLNEDLEESTEFPSTDFTENIISSNDISEEQFKINLTKEQINWIETNLGSLKEFTDALFALYYTFGEGLISIDNYVKELQSYLKNNGTLADYVLELDM